MRGKGSAQLWEESAGGADRRDTSPGPASARAGPPSLPPPGGWGMTSCLQTGKMPTTVQGMKMLCAGWRRRTGSGRGVVTESHRGLGQHFS